ncbi:MAG: M56 family metallopeptidase [Bacteroidetes bacterium]|nr:M56 family metallopeptidase [Bacteroidota bacterium]
MLQYLINTTIIWLACLLFYELLLRKESFHRYNRMYLLGSLAAGLLLPLLHLDSLMPANDATFLSPVKHVYQFRNTIQVSTAPTHAISVTESASYTSLILWSLYLAGVVTGLALLMREAILLFHLYKNGHKSVESSGTLIETGKEHSPFSFFNLLFVAGRATYNDAQWQLIVAHEREHARRLHSVDNLLLILLRIAFWFHPLPHIYYKRLRMLHEFQADEVATDANSYGAFLLEQNMLQAAPLLALSLHYSPIKKRILMLTKAKSTRPRLLKYLAALPLAAGLLVCCTAVGFPGNDPGKNKTLRFKGNEITFGDLKVIPFEAREKVAKQRAMFPLMVAPDSVSVFDRRSNMDKMIYVPSEQVPVALNGEAIYGKETQYWLASGETDYTAPTFDAPTRSLDEYLFARLRPELNKLENGTYIYNIDRMVVSAAGKLAYYEPRGLEIYMSPEEHQPKLDKGLVQNINQKLAEAIAAPLNFKPALKNGKPVNVRISLGNWAIEVKDHKAKLVDRGGC